MTVTVYRRIGKDESFQCPTCGERKWAGVYSVKRLTLVKSATSGYVGHYGEPCGADWYVDAQGREYMALRTDGLGYERDDGVTFFRQPFEQFAYDLAGNVIRTP